MRASSTIACLAFGMGALVGCQAPPQFTPQDEAVVRSLFDVTVKRVMAGDWAAWASEWSDNSVLHPPNAKAVSGRAALLGWGNAFPPIEMLSFSKVQVVGEGNMAYGTSAYALQVKGQPADTGKQLVVFRRSAAGKWEVVAGSFNSDLPLPAPAPQKAPPPAKRGR